MRAFFFIGLVLVGVFGDVFNPVVPVTFGVPGFGYNSRLRVLLIPTKYTWFAINFISDDGIIFHFNPRFVTNEIVINSMLINSTAWEAEEKLPQIFEINKIYTVDFLYRQKDLQMFVNEEHIGDFVERAPFASTNSINIYGDVQIHSYSISQ